jgi:hypothetical protein
VYLATPPPFTLRRVIHPIHPSIHPFRVNKPRKKEVCDSTKKCSNLSSILVCHLAFKLVVCVPFAIKDVIAQHIVRIYYWVKSRCTSALNHKLPFFITRKLLPNTEKVFRYSVKIYWLYRINLDE